MNLYFLVEGKRTEVKVYPKWLSHLLPDIKEVSDPFKISKNSYYLFNGNGFPSLLDNHLRNAVSDINKIGKFHYLIICLDSDDDSVEDRKTQVSEFIEANNIKLDSSKLVIIVQNKCIETWFLGNRKVYSSQPQNIQLRKYNRFYNVKEKNPELMKYVDGFPNSAQFHYSYLTEMFA